MNLHNLYEKIDWLNARTKEYDEGHPTVSDKEWDDVYFALEEEEQITGIVMNYSPTNTIPYFSADKLEKVEHNHPMLSLAKTKDWTEFLRYFGDHEVVGMVKLDGLTCSLRYVDGRLVSAETRGNGIVGEDIKHNVEHIANVPALIPYKDELIIDGEVICTYDNFEPFKDEYKNPRNFASGSIRLLDSKECARRNLSFVAWNVIKGMESNNSFLDRLFELSRFGFDVVPWVSSFDWDAADFLKSKAKELAYPIDGLVGRFDDIKYGESLGSTGHHSRAAFAFKFYDEEYDTKLIDIDWTMGRTGVLTPVAVFEPVDDGESIIQRASLHNIDVMYETMHGAAYVGEPIRIAKMNQIIPQVVWVSLGQFMPKGVKHIPMLEYCPICGEPTKIVTSDNGVRNMMCVNSQCNGKLINRIEHFFGKSALDAKGLSKKTIEKLLDWGWVDNIEDMFSLDKHYIEWIAKSGFGPKSVDNIIDSIKYSRECEWEKFLVGIGIPLIGRTAAKALAQEFKSYENFREAVKNPHYHFYKLEGFGDEMDASLKSFDYTEADRLAFYMVFIEKDKEVAAVDLTGKTFVITGKLKHYKNRDALKSSLEAAGAKVAGSVSGKTTYLVNNDNKSESAKNVKAKQLGVPVITEEEVMEMLGEKNV